MEEKYMVCALRKVAGEVRPPTPDWKNKIRKRFSAYLNPRSSRPSLTAGTPSAAYDATPKASISAYDSRARQRPTSISPEARLVQAASMALSSAAMMNGGLIPGALSNAKNVAKAAKSSDPASAIGGAALDFGKDLILKKLPGGMSGVYGSVL